MTQSVKRLLPKCEDLSSDLHHPHTPSGGGASLIPEAQAEVYMGRAP